MPDSKIIDKLVSLEWEMFHSVNGEDGPKASCQEDPVTFEGMRRAQFNAWDDSTVMAYLNDVEIAKERGRNLVSEKYIHMMKTTMPSQYEKLLEFVVYPSQQAIELADKITDKMIEQTRVLHEKYPYVSGSGRPLYSSADFGGFTSVETYQKGELYTYSEETLTCLWNHLCTLEKEGKSLAEMILLNSVKFYGYDSLESAEKASREYAESQPIEISFGCSNCGE